MYKPTVRDIFCPIVNIEQDITALIAIDGITLKVITTEAVHSTSRLIDNGDYYTEYPLTWMKDDIEHIKQGRYSKLMPLIVATFNEDLQKICRLDAGYRKLLEARLADLTYVRDDEFSYEVPDKTILPKDAELASKISLTEDLNEIHKRTITKGSKAN